MPAFPCLAHYPMLLNGFEVLCERYGGHPDQHENYTLSAPATMCWDDQPECWED